MVQKQLARALRAGGTGKSGRGEVGMVGKSPVLVDLRFLLTGEPWEVCEPVLCLTVFKGSQWAFLGEVSYLEPRGEKNGGQNPKPARKGMGPAMPKQGTPPLPSLGSTGGHGSHRSLQQLVPIDDFSGFAHTPPDICHGSSAGRHRARRQRLLWAP